MSSSIGNYVTNLGRLLRDDRVLRPLAVAYYATTQCNLNCAYCEEFGQGATQWRTAPGASWLPLEEALEVLRTIRSGTDHLILTGGEPLLHPDIVPLVARARRELGFRRLTLQTNGLLLPRHEALLPHLSRLVVSLDSLDAGLWSTLVGVPPETAETILDNVRGYARRQRRFGYRLVVNCVLSPRTLPGVPDLLAFCAEHGLLLSFSPQAVNNWPHYDLLVSDEYRALLRELLARKRRGAPILASRAYLRTLLEMRPFSCYPLLIPRVLPGGELVYPCRPIEREGSAHGGRPCNLRAVTSWRQALQVASGEYGPPPRVCGSCYQQCFAEPSLMQARPLALLAELLRYRASRRGRLASYAPG